MIKDLEKKMSELGYLIKVIPAEHLEDLKSDIEFSYQGGNIDENLYTWLKDYYKFECPQSTAPVESLVIVASKTPLVKVKFAYKGKEHTFVIPPTYLDFISEPEIIKNHLDNITDHKNHFIQANNLPNKLIANRSGLCLYGRNNLCYIKGLGSYLLITAFYSDIPVEEDSWGSFKQMEACENCGLCVLNCPTGALKIDRFAVRAESCLTYYNEMWGKDQFPEWIPSSAHNALVGCLRCQTVCPQNRQLLTTDEKVLSFSEQEVEDILGSRPLNEVPELYSKLESINMSIHYNYLSRNLQALLSKRD